MRVRPRPSDLAFAAIAVLVVTWAILGAPADLRLRVTLLAVPLGASLLFARRAPIPAVGLALPGMFLSDGAGDDTESAFLLALITACFAAGRYARLVHLPWVGAGTLLMVSGTLFAAESAQLADAVFPVLFTAGPCFVGLAIPLALRREERADVRARLLDAMRE